MSRKSLIVILLMLFLLSGFCNLVYEMVWTRMFNLVFGVTVFAISAVVAAFMFGLASGAIVFGRIAEQSRNPMLLFALIHAGICLSTIALLQLFPVFQQVFLGLHHLLNPDFFVFRIILFFLALLLMLLPTTLMGATFPVAAKILIRDNSRIGKDTGLLYSVNTLGSVGGCLVTVFFFLGFFGMKGTILAAAGLELLITLTALALSGKKIPERAA